MIMNQNAIKLELHQKEWDTIKITLDTMTKSKEPFRSKEVIYDHKLHSLLIKKIMEVHDDLKYLNPFDIEVVSSYSSLLDNLLTTQKRYIDDCFAAEAFPRIDEKTAEKRLEFLINELSYLSTVDYTDAGKDKTILEQQKNILLKSLNQHKNKISKGCSIFNVTDDQIISSMLTIINAFEGSDYGLFHYTTISDAYDAHGKSDDVDFYVFHPKAINYDKYNFCTPSKLKSILNSSNHDYIVHEEYNLNHFKNLSYLNLFLEEIAKWRFEYCCSNMTNGAKSLEKNSTFLSIPDEVLNNIVNEVIQSKEQTNKKLILK